MSEGSKPAKPIYKKWWFWLVVVVVVAAISQSGKNKTESTATSPAPSTEKGAASNDASKSSTSYSSAKVGDEVTFKDSKWTVLKAESIGKLLKPVGEYSMSKEERTEGIFVMVKFKVTNTSGKEESIMDTPKLIDGQGAEYKEKRILLMKDYFGDGAESMGMEALPNNIPKTFYAVYEVPSGSKALKFQARSLSAFPDVQLVPLGL